MSKKLENLRANFAEKQKRSKELREVDAADMSEIQAGELRGLIKDMEKLADLIDSEIESDKLDARNNGESRTLLGGHDVRESKGYEIRGAHQTKAYRDLYGATPLNPYSWDERVHGCSFYQAVFSGRFHAGLTNRAMTEGSGSDGGFLVPVEYASEIHNVSLENEIVMPRATVLPMKTNQKKLPAMQIGNHSSNLFGGFTASYSPERGTLSENNPKTREVDLLLKKLYGFLRFSNELFRDIPGSERQITEICGKGLGWYRDAAFLKGNGVGAPLGVLNSPCLIEVPKESSQAADTIVYLNLANMMARMHPACFANSVWVCHQTTIPQLLTLTIAVGDGGTHVPVMRESNGKFTMLTRPVIFTEKTEVLGDKGDILLADFSAYCIGLGEEMRIDFSPHLYFNTDEMAGRLIERHDGEPLWNEPLTLQDGSTTVSPFVTLAERAEG